MKKPHKDDPYKRLAPPAVPPNSKDINIAYDDPERVRAWYASVRKRIYKKEWATKEKEFEGCY